MSSDLPEMGQATALALVWLMVLAIPAGLALAQGMTTSSTITDTPITATLPPVNLTDTPTPTANGTATPTPTATSTASPGGGDGGGDGQRLVVAGGTGDVADGVTSEGDADCQNAKYKTIQRAVDDAAPGDTVVVCAGTYAEHVTIETADLTLQADDGAVIESPGEPAIRSNASGVTIRGFTMRTTEAEYTIAVGGAKTIIRDNTVNITTNDTTGIFLSDGLTPMSGEPDPDLGGATGSRVLNNTLHVTQNSNQNEIYRALLVDADQTVVGDNTIIPNDDTISIHSVGNNTVIRQNAIRNPDPCRQEAGGIANQLGDCHTAARPPSIVVGKQTFKASCEREVVKEVHMNHNWARQNHIGNNFISNIPGYGMSIGGTGKKSTALTATEGAVIKNNYLYQTGGMVGWADGAVFQNNTIDVDNRYSGEGMSSEGSFPEGGLCLRAHNTHVIGNTITDYFTKRSFAGRSISIRNNTFRGGNINVVKLGEMDEVRQQPTAGIIFINNTVIGSTLQEGVRIQHNVSVTEFAYNQITGNGRGVSVETFNSETDHDMYDVTIETFHHNNIADNRGYGLENDGRINKFHHNNITGNAESGVIITKDGIISGFHYNIIDNNGYLGIHKQNQDKADGEWSIVNATNNFWGCGGPSSGLEDPVTQRVANGTGDSISASDETGVSNINYDPFFVREDVTCPDQMSNPTPTPTPPATPTPTPTPPQGESRDSGDGGITGGEGSDGGTGGDGAGGRDGAGSGEGSGDGDGSGDSTGGESKSSGESGSSDDQTTPPPTRPSPSATPMDTPTATPSQTDSPTPTPAVEPGFGIGTWLIGVVIVAGLLALRRRERYHD